MALKEDKEKKNFFNLPKDDKINFDLEDEEKQEKDQAAEKVIEKLNEKYKKPE